MKINEFIKDNLKVTTLSEDPLMKHMMTSSRLPHIICADGFSMSVQVGYSLYSTPKKIAKRLNQLIKDGKAQSHIDLWEARRKVAEEHNKGLKKGTSDKNYKWEDSYPMHIENVQHFADFCADSGGFEIC